MSDHVKGLLITALGVVFIVPDSLFVRLIDADVWTISFWRYVSAGSVATIGLLVIKRRGTLQAIRQTGWQGAFYSVAVCVTGIMFVAAVTLTSVANVVLIIAAMPVFAAIFSRIVLKEPVSRRMVLTMLAVAGGLAVIAYGSGSNEIASIEGDLIALGTAFLFAIALTVARTKREVSMAPAVPIAFLVGALLLWPFAEAGSVPSDQWWILVVHGGFFIVMSITLLSIGPRYITSAEIALLILLESVLAPLLAWAVIGEHPGDWTLVGGAIVVGALLVSNLVVLTHRG